MTPIIELSADQRQAMLDANTAQAAACARLAPRRSGLRDGFVFFAAFDGTNNDMDDLAGDPLCTHVGQLWRQYQPGLGGPRQGGYYPGLGRNGRPRRETWLPAAVTGGVIATAEKAYADYATAAAAWRAAHPRSAVPVVLAAFSRGAASAAMFSQLLYQRGLVLPHPSGRVLVKPGKIRIAAGVLFDPVATGVKGNLALPPTAQHIVVFKALNEYRQLFKAVDYTVQKDSVTTLGFYGNHCDVGGGYDNGLAAVTLDAATQFLQKSGLTLQDVPASRRLEPAAVALHSEEYDLEGHKRWDVYYKDGFSFKDERLFDDALDISPASRPNAAGARGFTLYDGTRVTL